MPPGTSEARHVHRTTAQFYYILDGMATVDLSSSKVMVHADQGLKIQPGIPDQLHNSGAGGLEFLVAFSRPPREDRIDE
jgi:mannose-6-phosphate isomerase-like protein (cupin superfamily)